MGKYAKARGMNTIQYNSKAWLRLSVVISEKSALLNNLSETIHHFPVLFSLMGTGKPLTGLSLPHHLAYGSVPRRFTTVKTKRLLIESRYC